MVRNIEWEWMIKSEALKHKSTHTAKGCIIKSGLLPPVKIRDSSPKPVYLNPCRVSTQFGLPYNWTQLQRKKGTDTYRCSTRPMNEGIRFPSSVVVDHWRDGWNIESASSHVRCNNYAATVLLSEWFNSFEAGFLWNRMEITLKKKRVWENWIYHDKQQWKSFESRELRDCSHEPPSCS